MIELIIDRFINLKYKVETIFLEVEKPVWNFTSLLFIDNFGALVANKSILKIKKLLRKIGKTILY